MSIRVEKAENLDELLNSAKGIDPLFEKEEKRPALSSADSFEETTYDEEKREIEETRKYNEELQKSLGIAGEEEDEEDIEL